MPNVLRSKSPLTKAPQMPQVNLFNQPLATDQPKLENAPTVQPTP